MDRSQQLLLDIEYLAAAGATIDQIRQLHHWGGDPEREKRVTFATLRSYFGKEQEMQENKSVFADRVRYVAEAHQRVLPALIARANELYPRT